MISYPPFGFSFCGASSTTILRSRATRPDFSCLKNENNYICNRNEASQFTDYDINDCEATVNGNKGSSSVNDLGTDSWNVYVTDGNVLNIEAPEAAEVAIVSIDGITRMVNVDKGHNTFSGLTPGFYIVKGQKLVIR